MNSNKYLWMIFLALSPVTLLASNVGLYMGAGIGESVGPNTVYIANNDFNHDTQGTITGQLFDTYNFSTRSNTIYHFMAGYNFNPYVGFEASFSYLGKQNLISFSGSTTKNLGFDGTLDSLYYGMAVVGRLPFHQSKGDLFTKVGLSKVYSKIVINDPNGIVYVNPDNELPRFYWT